MRKKEPKKIYEEKKTSHNNFKILEEEEGEDKMKQVLKDNLAKKEKGDNMEDILDKNQQQEDHPSMMELDRD